jgi:hypothetical protein
MMKKLTQLTLTVLAVLTLAVSTNAETYFSDNYTVTGSGDADYQIDNGVRQSGTLSPTNYIAATVGAVSDSGDYAGLCHMTTWDGISPNEMYTNNAGNLVMEFDVIRYVTDWTAFAFGKDYLQDWHHIRSGMGIAFTSVNAYEIKDRTTQPYTGFCSEMGLSNAYNVKIVFAQDSYPASGDTRVAIFVNNKPLVMDDATKNYVYKYTAGFTNNYISMRGPLSFDNLIIKDALANKVLSTAWNNDSDSGISSAKTYTHAVNFANAGTTTVNGVDFIGSGTALPQSGPNWVFNNASPALGAYPISAVGETPNVTGAGAGLVTDCLIDANGFTSGELTLSGLTPGQEYIFTLYGIGLNWMSDNSRSNYFATSDGSTITMLDQKEFGGDNGQILNYTYTAPANGVFSIAAAPAVTNAGGVYCWYAFSNTQVPEPTILVLLGLLGLAFFCRKK